jgi:hypothetical protein
MGGKPAADRARRALAELSGTNADERITRAEGARVPTDRYGRGTLRRDGEYWTLALGEESAIFKDSKGLRYLAVLLGRSGHEIHAIDLAWTVEHGSPRHAPAAG